MFVTACDVRADYMRAVFFTYNTEKDKECPQILSSFNTHVWDLARPSRISHAGSVGYPLPNIVVLYQPEAQSQDLVVLQENPVCVLVFASIQDHN